MYVYICAFVCRFVYIVSIILYACTQTLHLGDSKRRNVKSITFDINHIDNYMMCCLPSSLRRRPFLLTFAGLSKVNLAGHIAPGLTGLMEGPNATRRVPSPVSSLSASPVASHGGPGGM